MQMHMFLVADIGVVFLQVKILCGSSNREDFALLFQEAEKHDRAERCQDQR